MFGTDDGEEFCRPELNAGDDDCLPGHNDLIDRYCIALDVADGDCVLVSRLVFSRGGEEGTTSIGEHVWDPTHAEASAEGGSSSVLSPPVRKGQYSCMSLHLAIPNPSGEAFSFDWDVGRRAEYEGEEGRMDALMRFYFFAAGAGHDPLDFDARSSDAYFSFGSKESGFRGWSDPSIGGPPIEVEELKWCYYGGNEEVGAQDIGRVDRLLIIEDTVFDFVLPVPNPGPAVVEGTVTSIRMRSQIPLAADRDVTIRLIVEEGGHFLYPDSLPVVNSTMSIVADSALSNRLVLEFTITGDGEAKEYALALPTHDDDRIDGAGNIALRFAEPPPSAEYRVGTPDRVYLLAVEDNEQPLTLDVETLLLWWQLVAQCDGSGDCFQPGMAAPELKNRPDLPDRTPPQLAALAATFQDLVDAGLLDFNADGRHDTLDLRLFLRYLAGLRGEALGSKLNTGTLSALRR